MSPETLEHQNQYISQPEKKTVSELSAAEKLLIAIEAGKDPDSDIIDLLHYSANGTKEARVVADEVGGLSLIDGVAISEQVPLKLGEQPIDELGIAFEIIAEERGEDSLAYVINRIEKAEQDHTPKETISSIKSDTVEETGIPRFDQLDDYSPESREQILMHRSNAELNEGDIVLPSNQIPKEMHHELNGERGFSSSSSPRSAGSGEHEFYDAKLAHAGTRDYGEVYGKYLYEVEPLEGDTPKWGENFGIGDQRKIRALSPAIRANKPASTDLYQGKNYNEVVSTRGFRVVKKIPHEPLYGETMLPWPVSSEAVAKNNSRYETKDSNVAPWGSETTPGYGSAFKVETNSRKRAGKIFLVDYPGSYRAGADKRNPSEWRTYYDVRKQQAENPGQASLPGLSISKYGRPDRWARIDSIPPSFTPLPEKDTFLPGMEGYEPSGPPKM